MKRYRTIIFILLVSIVVFSNSGIANKVNATGYFDSFGNIPWVEERAHLENFAGNLISNPDAIGYIGFYTGRKGKSKLVKSRITRAKNYLISEFKIDASRIVMVNGGKSDETTIILQPIEKNFPPLELK